MPFGDSLKFSVGLDLNRANRDLAAFGARARSITSEAATFGGIAAKASLGAAAGFAAMGVALKSTLQASSDMEQFEAQLTTIMGSASGAKARMTELFDFAAKTKFNTAEIVQADVTLRGFGANAEELLPRLIDFSSALGTDLSQSAIDFGKAWNQGGVGLESDTGKILKSMIETTAGVKTADMSIQEFRDNLGKTLDANFAGGADRAAKTFAGMVSNMEDEWEGFKRAIGEAGLFDSTKATLQLTLDLIGKHRTEINAVAAAISGGVIKGLTVAAFDIAMLVDGTRLMVNGFKLASIGVAQFIASLTGGLSEVYRQIGEVAAALGQDGLAAAYGKGAKALAGVTSEMEAFSTETANSYEEWTIQNSAVMATAEGLKQINDLAKEYGKTVEETTKQQQKTAEMAAESGKKKQTDDGLTARFESALEFSRDMLALNQSETQALMAEYAKRMGALLEYNRQGLITGQLFADTRIAIEQNYQDQVDAMRERAAQEEKARRQAIANDTISGTSSLFSTLQGMLDQQNAEQKAAYKALGIAQVAISTAVGISRAFSDYGWPGGIAPAALTAATGAAQIAAIASAHQGTSGEPVVYMHQGGGPRRPSPDEMDVRKLRTEAVLNSQATRALGPQGVNALNSGAGMAPMMVDLKVGRVTQREMFRTEIRTSGSRLTRYVEEVGRSGDKAAGFSGGVARA